MAATTPLLSAFATRRSIYALSNSSPISDARLHELCSQVLTHTPSPFNTQGARIVLLLGAQHRRFWDLAETATRATFPEAMWAFLLPKIAEFRGAYGTALFWSNPAPLLALGEKHKAIAPLFPQWTEHSQGMHHYALWTILEAEGFGANLQHYSMLEEPARREWNIPPKWHLKAQLVFGTPTGGPARVKTFEEIDGHRLFVHGTSD